MGGEVAVWDAFFLLKLGDVILADAFKLIWAGRDLNHEICDCFAEFVRG